MQSTPFGKFDPTRPLQIVPPLEEWCGTDDAAIRRGFQTLIDMGLSGLVTNVKLEKYLSDEESWSMLRRGAHIAHEMGLRVWIYDEKGYPSGSAGGLVLQQYPQGEAEGLIRAFHDDGRPRHEVTKLFENTHATANFFERRHYPNILDPKAVATFISVTHDAYERALHPIGEFVEAFFTDEPSLISAYVPAGLDYPKTIPWYKDLPRLFRARKGYELTPSLESLFVETGPHDRKIRCDFYEVISDLCAETYFGQLQDWCQSHKVLSSGHLLGEETLVWQTVFNGDPFTCYRRFDLPGIDMILSSPERIMQDREPFFLVPKVASSAARIQGKRRVMCEISDFFGMMGGRHATVDQMKCTAGVLMSLGVTDFTSYYSVSLKRDQPPDPSLKARRFSVPEYRAYTDYVSRVNMLLAEGELLRKVAILHPIVSLWANFTPSTRSMYENHPNDRVRLIDDSFAGLCRELIQHQVEYDVVDERSVAAGTVEGESIVVGRQAYDVMILPPMDTIRQRTADVLLRFVEAGGTVFAHPLRPEFAAEGVEMDAEVKKLMNAILAKGFAGSVKPESTPIHYLVRSRIPPMCHLTPSSPDILCTTFLKDGNAGFFLVNASGKEYAGAFVFRAKGRPILTDPGSSEERHCDFESLGDAGIRIEATLAPYGSLFVHFR